MKTKTTNTTPSRFINILATPKQNKFCASKSFKVAERLYIPAAQLQQWKQRNGMLPL